MSFKESKQEENLEERLKNSKKSLERCKIEYEKLLQRGIAGSSRMDGSIEENQVEGEDKKLMTPPKPKKNINSARSDVKMVESSPRKQRNYDVNGAREFIKKQQEKRKEMLKVPDTGGIAKDLKKQKLLELHKKSLEILAKCTRSRSKSREKDGKEKQEESQKKTKSALRQQQISNPELNRAVYVTKIEAAKPEIIEEKSEKEKPGIKIISNVTIRKPQALSSLPELKRIKPDLFKAATIIQKHYRGYRERKIFATIRLKAHKDKAKVLEMFQEKNRKECELEKFGHNLEQQPDLLSILYPPVTKLEEKAQVIPKKQLDSNAQFERDLIKNIQATNQIENERQKRLLVKLQHENDVQPTQEKKPLHDWLQPHPYPYNFINVVKRKLNYPNETASKTNLGYETAKTVQEIKELIKTNLQETQKRQPSQNELEAFLYKNCANLDLKKVESLKLKSKISSDHSDSDTSKNIPDISVESNLKTGQTNNYDTSFEIYSEVRSKKKSSESEIEANSSSKLSRASSDIIASGRSRSRTRSSKSDIDSLKKSKSSKSELDLRSESNPSRSGASSKSKKKSSEKLLTASSSEILESINESEWSKPKSSDFIKLSPSSSFEMIGRAQNYKSGNSQKLFDMIKSQSNAYEPNSKRSDSKKYQSINQEFLMPPPDYRSNSTITSVQSLARDSYNHSKSDSHHSNHSKISHRSKSHSSIENTSQSVKSHKTESNSMNPNEDIIFKKPSDAPPLQKSNNSSLHSLKSKEYQINTEPLKDLKLTRSDTAISSHIEEPQKPERIDIVSFNATRPKQNTMETSNVSEDLASFLEYMKDLDKTKQIVRTNSNTSIHSQSSKSFRTLKSYKTESSKSSSTQRISSEMGTLDGYSTRFSGGSDNENVPSLKVPLVSLQNNSSDKENEDENVKKVVLKEGKNTVVDVKGSSNQIHVKFEAELHLLNDFNESLRHIMAIEKSLVDLQSKNQSQTVLQNIDTQTSFATRTSREPSKQEKKSSIYTLPASINISRGSDIEEKFSREIDSIVTELNELNLQNGNENSVKDSLLIDDTNTAERTKKKTYKSLPNNVSVQNESRLESTVTSLDLINNSLIIDDSIAETTITSLDLVNSSLVIEDPSKTSLEISDEPMKKTKQESFKLTQTYTGDNSKNLYAGLSLGMFEQFIKDEDARIENLKTILKIREKVLLDRTKGELAWLEIQKKHLLETGNVHEASLVKKKQRGILIKLQHEKHEMQKLKQLEKAASKERKTILKEQRNMIKDKLSTNNTITKIKKSKERRTSGPLKVYNYHKEFVQSERISSVGEEIFYTSHSESVRISENNETSKDENKSLPKADKFNNHTEIAKRSLLMREAALQKRRKAAEELLQWHQKLIEEEKKIAELEMAASNIINKVPTVTIENTAPKETYSFKGYQLNNLWKTMTGREERKFNDTETYNLSQIAFERFCKDAQKISNKNKRIKEKLESSQTNINENSESESVETPVYTQEFTRKDSTSVEKSALNEIQQNISNITDEISQIYKLSSERIPLNALIEKTICEEIPPKTTDNSIIEISSDEEEVIKSVKDSISDSRPVSTQSEINVPENNENISEIQSEKSEKLDVHEKEDTILSEMTDLSDDIRSVKSLITEIESRISQQSENKVNEQNQENSTKTSNSESVHETSIKDEVSKISSKPSEDFEESSQAVSIAAKTSTNLSKYSENCIRSKLSSKASKNSSVPSKLSTKSSKNVETVTSHINDLSIPLKICASETSPKQTSISTEKGTLEKSNIKSISSKEKTSKSINCEDSSFKKQTSNEILSFSQEPISLEKEPLATSVELMISQDPLMSSEKADDLEKETSIISEKQISIPPENLDLVSSEKEESIKAEKQTSISSEKADNVSSRKEISTASEKQVSMSSEKADSVPSRIEISTVSEKQTSISSEKADIVPSRKEISAASEKEASICSEKADTVSSRKEISTALEKLTSKSSEKADTVPSRKEISIASERQASIFVEKEDSIPSAKEISSATNKQPSEKVDFLPSEKEITTISEKETSEKINSVSSEKVIATSSEKSVLPPSEKDVSIVSEKQVSVSSGKLNSAITIPSEKNVSICSENQNSVSSKKINSLSSNKSKLLSSSTIPSNLLSPSKSTIHSSMSSPKEALMSGANEATYISKISSLASKKSLIFEKQFTNSSDISEKSSMKSKTDKSDISTLYSKQKGEIKISEEDEESKISEITSIKEKSQSSEINSVQEISKDLESKISEVISVEGKEVVTVGEENTTGEDISTKSSITESKNSSIKDSILSNKTTSVSELNEISKQNEISDKAFEIFDENEENIHNELISVPNEELNTESTLPSKENENVQQFNKMDAEELSKQLELLSLQISLHQKQLSGLSSENNYKYKSTLEEEINSTSLSEINIPSSIAEESISHIIEISPTIHSEKEDKINQENLVKNESSSVSEIKRILDSDEDSSKITDILGEEEPSFLALTENFNGTTIEETDVKENLVNVKSTTDSESIKKSNLEESINNSEAESSLNVPVFVVTIEEKNQINKDSLEDKDADCVSEEIEDYEESSFESPKSDRGVELSPQVDVKKRVSEILADANINNSSVGDKSPRLQDLYVTTYDVISPANSPELGSPIDQKSFIPQKDFYGSEAEKLMRIQMAIEQEIKQLQQQQKEQLPYLYVREIPNKPPPPYKPPQSTSLVVTSIIPADTDQITTFTSKVTSRIYESYIKGELNLTKYPEDITLTDVNGTSSKYIFDLCKEMAIKHYSQFEENSTVSWLKLSKYNYKKPLDAKGLENLFNQKLKELFANESLSEREKRSLKWSRKKRDHVHELLAVESQSEEPEWTNYDYEELIVKDQVTNDIMNMLLSETADIFKTIFSKHTSNHIC